jgi:serine/threonine protein kinase
MEKMNGGTLQHLINKISQSNEGNAKSFYLSEEQASKIMRDIFKGLE